MPILAGHRGIGNPWTVTLKIPEESIPAIEYAAAHHADIVEGDAQITRDGKMVMMHDDSIDRTTSRTGLVKDRSLAYIKEAWLEIPIDANNNQDFDNTPYHPPSLNQWMAAAKRTNKRIFIELKGGWDAAQIRRYVNLLKTYGVTSRVITAGSERELDLYKGMSNGSRSWSVGHFPSPVKVRSVATYATISLANAEERPSYIKNLQDSTGVKVFVWTLDNPAHYERALKLGAYGWFCDNTDDAWTWLQNILL